MIDVFCEISQNWKLEAKAENSERYFFPTEEIDEIVNGNKCYIIGRKGTGKTAISENILSLQSFDIFCDKLSFKNFPFSELYTRDDSKYNFPNQYITIWKYIIYSKICQMMSANEKINLDVSVKLRHLFEPDPLKRLDKEIKKWTAEEFGVEILGVGGNIKGVYRGEQLAWIERVEILEEIIAHYLDDSTYYLCFDELDEDYREILEPSKRKSYLPLLTGLFKAVQSIKSTFKCSQYKLFPIIFLRDDIYELIEDADKAKWDDFKTDIEWNEDKIKKVLSFRIERAFDCNASEYSFPQSWQKLFTTERIEIGSRNLKYIHIFDYMTRSTHIRPRDYIKYIVSSVKESESPARIKSSTVKKADKIFSNYLKAELIGEMQGFMPDVKAIFEIISTIRKQTFHLSDFRNVYKQKVNEGTLKDYSVEFILKVLFLFSVIGNQPTQVNKSVFKYTYKGAQFNFNEPIMVHRGLYQALQIF